jgi:hypothetical protein
MCQDDSFVYLRNEQDNELKKPENSASTVDHLATTFMVISYLAYISTLKIELICPSEMSADFLWAALRYIPEDIVLHSLNSNFVKNIGT